MKDKIVKPGDVVVTEFSGYQHWSLVSDKLCEKGQFMLISATKRNKTVKEEPWHDVTQGKHTYVANFTFSKSVPEVIASARSQIDKWKYSISSMNCEHFVNWAAGLGVNSKQVAAGTTGFVTGAALVVALADNPKMFKILGTGALIAGLAIWAVKATEKTESTVNI